MKGTCICRKGMANRLTTACSGPLMRGTFAEEIQMKRCELAAQAYRASCIKGHFVLRSGRTSNDYFDNYLFEAGPCLLKGIAEGMAGMVPTNGEVLAGLEMVGIPVVTVFSQLTGLPVLFVRKKAKEHGTSKLAEGQNVAGEHLVVVENVVTSGGQIVESTKGLRALGAVVEDVIGVTDRESGASDNLPKEGLSFRVLFTMSELKRSAKPSHLPDTGGKDLCPCPIPAATSRSRCRRICRS